MSIDEVVDRNKYPKGVRSLTIEQVEYDGFYWLVYPDDRKPVVVEYVKLSGDVFFTGHGVGLTMDEFRKQRPKPFFVGPLRWDRP